MGRAASLLIVNNRFWTSNKLAVIFLDKWPASGKEKSASMSRLHNLLSDVPF
jgi:hypothetical protein